MRQAHGKTVDDVAKAAELSPTDVRKLEMKRLDKIEVATLRRYVKGVTTGAEVHLAVVVDGRRYVLTG